MKTFYIFLAIILPAVMGQVVLSTKSSCNCYQLSYETECVQLSPYCTWSVNAQNVGQCITTQCTTLQSQADCVQLINCVWGGEYCESYPSYQNCSQLKATSSLSCQQQNRSCFGTEGQCISQDQLPQCQSYTTQDTCKFGQQGKCSWSGNGCYYYENCSQIPAEICSSFSPYETNTPKGAYCYVNEAGVCVQSSCSVLTTESTCTYVQTIFNQDQFILCTWNSVSKTCTNATTTSNLTQEDCLTSTLLNYHWIANNNQTTDGTCFLCQFRLTGTNSCLCNQLIAEYDCINAKVCTWQSNQCVTTICSTITTQSICAQSPACMWVFGQSSCQPFTRCSDLKGVNQYQCLAQSNQCASSNGIYCTQLPNTQKNPQSLCSQITEQQLCTNSFLPYGFCQWGYYNNTQCTFSASCYNIYSQSQCENMRHSCMWNGYSCQQLSCYTFTNENDCTFYYYYAYNGQQQFYCQWNTTYRQCEEIPPQALSYDNCYVNTLGKYRWSSHDSKVGTCVQCGSALLPNRNSKCECNQLIYQGDCALASESCTWNFNIDQCVPLDCTTLRTRGTCISNYNCHWIQKDSVEQCLPFKSCDKLPGSNSYQCMLYSYRCTSSDGQYCKDLSYTNTSNTCSSIPNYTNCYLTIARDGVCRWNEQQQKCYSLQECNQITIPELCGVNNYACIWNYVTEQCQSVSCDNVTTEQECTYFDKTVGTTPSIQMCLWNNTCVNATSADEFNSVDCFINSARTHYWSKNNATDGSCLSCSYGALLFITIAIGIIS